VSALCCAVALLTAGCHSNSQTSGYGVEWVTVTDDPGDFTSYIVTIDSITMTRTDGAVVTAASVPEIVDLAQLNNFAEMWGSTAIPIGQYVSATITMDYTNASVAVMVNGVPTKVTLVDPVSKSAPTTYSITVAFDPNNMPNITPTYASTSAQRLALNFNLAASGLLSLATTPPVLTVRPFVTASVQPADTKLIRIRGPLINSNVDVQTYTVYIRPFYDEANNIGTLSLFNQPNTIFTINGNTYVGPAGLTEFSKLSAGTTMTAAYTTFEPDYNSLNGAYAGKWNLVYVIGASSLEDQYTEGLSGDVIARNGNTLTLRGSTLFLNTANTYAYLLPDTQVTLGSGTIVTADDNTTLTGLTEKSISVGQHISARGIYGLTANGTTELDATGTSDTNTGSVRLQQTQLWGSLVSEAAGSVVMNVQTINNWPISNYNFTGNGAAALDPTNFVVNPGTLALPAGTAVGDPVWINGFTAPYGSAPPDFLAVAVANEPSVQVAGGQFGGAAPLAPGAGVCGLGSQVCVPANMIVSWVPGTTAPFLTFTAAGFSVDLSNANLLSGVIRIGPESIDLASLPASPLVVPTTLAVTSTFAPNYTVGNPATATTTTTVTSTTSLHEHINFAAFVTDATAQLTAAAPALQLQATGIYDRSTNTFTATSVNFVL
jgi:hypothetical protein